MTLFRVNYEEYLHYEEFIEAADAEEAERVFKNSIQTLDPIEGEIYTLDVEEAIETKKEKPKKVYQLGDKYKSEPQL